MPPPPPSTLHHRPLLKHRSWSPDTEREEAWERRKDLQRARRGGRTSIRSVTDEDLNELRGCIDLGIVFADEATGGGDCPSRLAEILPALDLYLAVRRGLNGNGSTGGSSASESSSAAGSPACSPLSIFSAGSSSSEMKASLKRWAQVVACTVRQRN